MKKVAKVKLCPNAVQRAKMLAAMERFNEACNWLAGKAFELQTANFIRLHHAFYRELREKFSLPSQMAQLVIDKVIGAYVRNLSILPVFKPRSAITFDRRNYSYKSHDDISLTCLDGRERMPFISCDHFDEMLEKECTQADLVLRKGKWYFFITVEVEEKPCINPKEFLGVDLGIVNLATNSDGHRYSGEIIEDKRVRLAKLRQDLQKSDTYSARRHLKKIGHREANFRADVSHCISKAIVAEAERTCRGIGLEDLTGIRDRVTVRKAERARLGGWGFYQLRFFISYKAQRAGIPVVLVDPRNTSRTCPVCNHCEKKNRKSRDEFVCKSCGFTECADRVGAVNIARRATANWPIVSSAGPSKRIQSAALRSKRSSETSRRLESASDLGGGS